MSFFEVKRDLLRNFLLCVEEGQIPPLGEYFADYVTDGGKVSADEYGLLPITTAALGWLTTSSDCLTDCMIELRSKYEEHVDDEFGGHKERGWRELGVVGFNILEGIVLDIRALEGTTRRLAWAEPKLASIRWERILIRAVVEFGRYCSARQVRLQTAYECPPSGEGRSGRGGLGEFQRPVRARQGDNARALGFDYDKALDGFVFDL